MTTYSRPQKWKRWAGTLDTLIHAAEVALEEVQDAGPADFLAVSVSAQVDGLEVEGDSLDVLRSLPSIDLAKIERISIDTRAGADRWRDERRVNIRVRADDRPGLGTQVTAESRTFVEGLNERLRAILDPGKQRPGWDRFLMTVVGVSLAIILVALGPAFARAVGLASQNDRWEPAEAVFLVGGVLIGAVTGLGGFYLLPPLELLASDTDRTRMRRFRGLVWGFLLAVGASIVAGVVIALLT